MKNPLKSDASVSLGLLLARLPIGAFFLIAGYDKLREGVNKFVAFASQSATIPQWVPPGYTDTYLHVVPFLEVAIGAMLLLGLLTRLGALIGGLMVVSYVVGLTHLHGNTPSDQALPFHPNLIYLGLLLALLFVGPGRFSLDGVLFGKKKHKPAAQ